MEIQYDIIYVLNIKEISFSCVYMYYISEIWVPQGTPKEKLVSQGMTDHRINLV